MENHGLAIAPVMGFPAVLPNLQPLVRLVPQGQSFLTWVNVRYWDNTWRKSLYYLKNKIILCKRLKYWLCLEKIAIWYMLEDVEAHRQC